MAIAPLTFGLVLLFLVGPFATLPFVTQSQDEDCPIYVIVQEIEHTYLRIPE